jgi:hypothetical protein
MNTVFKHLAANSEALLGKDLLAFADSFDATKGYRELCQRSISRGVERCKERGADPTLYMLANLGYRAVLQVGMQRLIDAETEAERSEE